MYDKRIIISIVSVALLYVVLLKTTCDVKETSYYDTNSMLYAAIVGVLIFIGLGSFGEYTAAPGEQLKTVGENVMTTPFQ